MGSKYKLLVFDWDGTLMNSQAHIITCFLAAIQDLGLPSLAAEKIRNIIGLGLIEAIQALYPNNDIAFCEQLADRYRQHFLHGDYPSGGLFEGAEETLAQLKCHNYLLAVATSKSRRGLDHVLSETGIGAYFDLTRCADETYSKPHPEMLLQLTSELAIAPTNALMIGDTAYDLMMAQNANVDAAAVSYGAHDLAQLMACQPKTCLHAITDLIPWLKQAD